MLALDREAATIEAWLADHPEVEVVSRDRGGGYGQAVARAAPEGVQVADKLAPDEERQPGLSRWGAAVDAAPAIG